jgi:hypothetical protein
MKRVVVMVTGVALLLALAVGTAGANDVDSKRAGQTFETKVIFKKVVPPLRAKRGVHYFKGVVKSDKRVCRNFRPLELRRDGNLVTSDSSDGDAKFKIEIQAFVPGEYRVVAPVYSGGAGITCKADKSKPYVREP